MCVKISHANVIIVAHGMRKIAKSCVGSAKCTALNVSQQNGDSTLAPEVLEGCLEAAHINTVESR